LEQEFILKNARKEKRNKNNEEKIIFLGIDISLLTALTIRLAYG
jgi:hypothetical protein